ncbi:hypothetical protein ACWKSP_29490 [Micromonosporaceae bacterium Da 78-11]
MAEFYVDAVGLNGLYSQLARASGDAADVLEYTEKHCDLAWNTEGLLMIFLGPHDHAYDSLTEAITRLRDLAQGAGTQINRAQLDYAKTDEAAAGRVDATYAGAKSPEGVRGTVTQGRPDLVAQRAGFTDVAEPTARLRSPEYAVGIEMWSINPLADLISPAAWLRQISIWLFGKDPFDGWAKEFSGDWQAYVHCGAAIGCIGSAAHDIGRNLVAGAADCSTVWRGNAAEAEQEFQLALGAAAMDLEVACRQFDKLYHDAAEATKKLFDVVSGMMTDLIDILIIINGAMAAGTALIETGIGPLAGYGIAAYYSWQAYDLYQHISDFFGNAEDVLNAIGGTIGSIDAKLAIRDLPAVQPYRHPAGY